MDKVPLMWMEMASTHSTTSLDWPEMGCSARSNIVRWQQNWGGQQADRDSIYISACGAMAVMQVNAGADIIMVWCLLELLLYCTIHKSSCLCQETAVMKVLLFNS
jgi:hypothetical protein